MAPRSGLALKDIDVAAGVIDPDYRGEIKVVLVNNGVGCFKVERGMRIAQLILERIVTDKVVQVERLPTPAGNTSGRGSSGFGSTGLTYLSMDHDTEEEPISAPETTTADADGNTAASSQVPSH